MKNPLVAFLLLLVFAALIAVDPDLATAIAAAVAIVGGLLTLVHADATARRARTAEYRARWDHPELLAVRKTASEFFNVTGAGEGGRLAAREARWKDWNEWIAESRETTKRLHVMAILNFWEEVASAYNQDLLDNAWFRTDLAWQMEHNWKRAGWFIGRSRTDYEDADLFCEWQVAIESVEDDLRRQEKDARRRARDVLPDEDILRVDRS